MTVMAGGLWTALLAMNLATSPNVPWAIVAMGVLLWLTWQYLGGTWGPRSTSQARRARRRARSISPAVFTAALLAGGLAIVALAGFWIVAFQLAHVAGNALPDFSQYPPVTVALALVMASLVAAVAEEVGFRGYFQSALEQRLSPPLAILAAALVIAPAHALTQGLVWPTFLFYLCVDIAFGTMAYLTRSIWPGIVVHAVGLLVFFTLVWPQAGLDPWFWVHLAQATVFAILTIWAFRRLAAVASQAGIRYGSPLPPTYGGESATNEHEEA
jgi:membrane protease YdiL (CAAX protease family)